MNLKPWNLVDPVLMKASQGGAGDKAGRAIGQRRSGRQALSATRSIRADRSRSKSSAAVAPHYSMVIQWSDEDRTFIVTLPEFDNLRTHGDTYEQAVRQGKDLIESCIIWWKKDRRPLPKPAEAALVA